MKVSLSIAEKLLLLAGGAQLPASAVRGTVVDELVADGIITATIAGRTKRTLAITDNQALNNWLFNRYGINDLSQYVAALKEPSSRADMVFVASDSKQATSRTFKGFLVNSYEPITCTINGSSAVIHPMPGTFQFVYDFEYFKIDEDVVIVGVENAEVFRNIDKVKHLFAGSKKLFVSRYPQQQGKDLLQWLGAIPNSYVHFGDFDFAGINIFLQEYKKYLGERASFFLPADIEPLLARYGNRHLYDRQHLNDAVTGDKAVVQLIALLHKYKKGLEQEVLLVEKKCQPH